MILIPTVSVKNMNLNPYCLKSNERENFDLNYSEVSSDLSLCTGQPIPDTQLRAMVGFTRAGRGLLVSRRYWRENGQKLALFELANISLGEFSA